MDSTELLIKKAAFAFRRAFAANRLPFILIGASAAALVAAIAFYAASDADLRAARTEAARLAQSTAPTAIRSAGPAQAKIHLKEFQSSHLLAILEQGAASANIKLDEISFAFDDSPNQPYVRYRASFQVVSRYPTIRKFIAEILAGSEGVVLDTVSCWREDINAADVRCDISAYVAYQEKSRG